jgi:RNA polymerase sigma-70 factor (ECF subfamily)
MQATTLREEALRDQIVGLLPRIRRFARGLTKDPYRADDLVQEACERALERLHQFAEDSRLDSWLYRIVYTRWIDRLRRSKTRSAHLALLEKDASEGAASNAAAGIERLMDVRDALAALPQEHRAAVLLVGVEGHSYAEAAAVMDIPVGTVASRVARGRSILAEMLSPRPGDAKAQGYGVMEVKK